MEGFLGKGGASLGNNGQFSAGLVTLTFGCTGTWDMHLCHPLQMLFIADDGHALFAVCAPTSGWPLASPFPGGQFCCN